MFSRFRSKIMVHRNRHEYSFENRTDWFSAKMQIKHGYQSVISYFDFWIFGKLINNFFFTFKKLELKKNGIHV